MPGESPTGGADRPDPAVAPDAVPLPAAVLDRYRTFTCYNSPYPAHDRGCAVDLYPDSGAGVSPVAGEVLDTRTVGCPDRHYAVDHDHLVVVDVADDWAGGVGRDLTARILHVDPAVEPGEAVDVGDSLGELVRSGFFAQWVDDHVHLGFRPEDANPYRASGSLPVDPRVDVAGGAWDGTGTVVDVGETYVRLDAPAHPDPGSWATLAADDGTPLDGGLVHYAGGGAYGEATGELSLLGTAVGEASRRAGPAGRDVDWADVAVHVDRLDADGPPVRATGLSLFAAREDVGVKVVFHEGHGFAVGDAVAVSLSPTADPVHLG